MLKYKECLNPKLENLNFIKNYKSVRNEEGTVIVDFQNGKMEITYYENDIIKVFIGETHEESSNTTAIISELKVIQVKYENSEEYIRIIGKKVDTFIEKNSLRISFRNKEGNVICQDFYPSAKKGKNIFISKVNDCVAYYGFGEKGGGLNKKGCYLENYNTDDPGYDDNTVLFYKTIPFYVGVKENSFYGIYLDNSYRSFFDMGKESKERIYFGAENGSIQYYFMSGENIKEVIKDYGILTGTMDMPPLWTLGYQQCRYSYYTRNEVESLAKTFREKEIPCDTIYLDIDYMYKYKVMTFNKEVFQKPEEMIGNLNEDGFKLVTIVDPGVKIDDNYGVYKRGLQEDVYVKSFDGKIYENEVWAGKSVFPDFASFKAREWWKDELKNLIRLGVSGIWNDMNEPACFDEEYKTIPDNCLHYSEDEVMEHSKFHNMYGMFMSRCSKEAQEEINKNKRAFSMTRATFSGGQRYSSIWTGDNQSTWEHLRMCIPMNCNLGLSGFSFVGNDVGGFTGDCEEELFIRWMQLGTFTPIFRNHSAVGTRRQEPWAFGKNTEKAAKKAIKLRYKFIPYIYNMYYKSHKEGLGVFRPMILEYPKDVNVIDMYSQFMFGDSMLVAPVLYKGERNKVVYLPDGKWYDYFTHKEFEGGTYYKLEVPLDEILVFVKEGSIIPVYDEHYNYIGEKNIPVTLEIFKGLGEITYYEDDNISLDYKKGIYNLYKIKSENTDKKQEVCIDKIYNGITREEKFKVKYIV